jgi:hypothetical protein
VVAVKRALGCVFFWLACYLLSSCAHRFQKHQTAARTEQETRTFQTAENAASQTQSVSSEKKAGSKRTREFDPKTGILVKDVLEHWGSDGRVQVSASASASQSASGADFSSVVARSSSTRASSTSWWTPWWLWCMGALAVAAGAWALRQRIRARIPFL